MHALEVRNLKKNLQEWGGCTARHRSERCRGGFFRPAGSQWRRQIDPDRHRQLIGQRELRRDQRVLVPACRTTRSRPWPRLDWYRRKSISISSKSRSISWSTRPVLWCTAQDCPRTRRVLPEKAQPVEPAFRMSRSLSGGMKRRLLDRPGDGSRAASADS